MKIEMKFLITRIDELNHFDASVQDIATYIEKTKTHINKNLSDEIDHLECHAIKVTKDK